MFLGALLYWHGSTAPTSDEIAGARSLDQGKMHLRAIWETGGAILGHRSLKQDGVEPWTSVDGWGYLVIKYKAEDQFLRRSTITGRTGAEEFAARHARGGV
jgi:hypothetical protein